MNAGRMIKEKNKGTNHEGKPVANFRADELKELYGKVDFDKAFYHEVKRKAWRWFLPVKGGGAIVLPIYPGCPVQLFDQKAFEDDIEEFKRDVEQERLEHNREQRLLLSDLETVSKKGG